MVIKKVPNYRYGHKKAQSFLMYALLIGVVIGVLLTMQRYVGRSLQGLLKQNLDNMGGEKVAGKQYSPGRWYGSKSLVRINTSGFDYEGRHGFGVMIGNSQRSESTRITESPRASDLPPVNLDTKTVLDDRDKQLVRDTRGSALDPGIDKVNNTVNNNAADWKYVSEKKEGSIADGTFDNVERKTQDNFNEYTPDPNPADYPGAVVKEGESGEYPRGQNGSNLPENQIQ